MAIFRARGGNPVTSCPSISTVPLVGCSSPATVRNRVVLPHPDGPSRARYSPSSVARSTPSMAWTLPCARPPSYTLCRSRTSTVPMSPADQATLAPLGEDGVDLFLRGGDRLRRRGLAARRRREHVRDDEGVEHLPLGRVRRAGVSDVGGPPFRVGQEGQLVGGLGVERVLLEPRVQLWRQLLPGAEVVQLGVVRHRREVGRVVKQELLRGVDALGVLGNDPVVDHVLRGEGGLRPLQRGYEVHVVRDLGVLLLRGTPGGDRVEDVRGFPRDQRLIVRRGVPAEYL